MITNGLNQKCKQCKEYLHHSQKIFCSPICYKIWQRENPKKQEIKESKGKWVRINNKTYVLVKKGIPKSEILRKWKKIISKL